MKRRIFIGSMAALALLGTAVGGSLVTTSSEEVIIRIVRRRFPGLNIADGELRSFARDFLVYDRTSRPKLAALRAILPVVESPTLSGVVPDSMRALFHGLERRVVTKFALSTDLFLREADDPRPLAYTGFADPYLNGCANPVARFDLEET